MSYNECKQIKEKQAPREFFDGLVYVFPEINQEEYGCVYMEDGEATIDFFREEDFINPFTLDGLLLTKLDDYLKEHPTHILFLTINKKDGYAYVTDVFEKECNWARGEYIEYVHYERYCKYLKEYDIPFVEASFVIENFEKSPEKYQSLKDYKSYLLKNYDFKDENGGIIYYRGRRG